MFIDLTRLGRLTIDPARYPDTLVVALDVLHNKPEYGIFAGRNDFREEEREKIVPALPSEEEWWEGECEMKNFVLSRPSMARTHLINRWYYAAIGYDNGVYVGHPYAYEITLEELGPTDPDSKPTWSVIINGNGCNFRLILPDYKPMEKK